MNCKAFELTRCVGEASLKRTRDADEVFGHVDKAVDVDDGVSDDDVLSLLVRVVPEGWRGERRREEREEEELLEIPRGAKVV